MALQVGDVTDDGERVVDVFLGIPVTAEGKARARAQLDAARARLTPERLNEIRAQVGMPPRPVSHG